MKKASMCPLGMNERAAHALRRIAISQCNAHAHRYCIARRVLGTNDA